jgi:putative N-acetyltransferase (TIGR04045 family)
MYVDPKHERTHAGILPLHELPMEFSPSEYRIKWAQSHWEREQAYALRRAVFCIEQRLFDSDDIDSVDAHAQLIVATSCMAGIADQVVGTVRIHEAEPGIWWGSRLAVAADFRLLGKLGATLIRLAVRSAHGLGCRKFLAHVQRQNVPMFKRLHWSALREITLHERPHQLMSADLDSYPPYHMPFTGFVTQGSPGGIA